MYVYQYAGCGKGIDKLESFIFIRDAALFVDDECDKDISAFREHIP